MIGIVTLFRAIFGRSPEEAKGERPNLPCVGKVWLTKDGYMMWSSKVQPGDYRGEMPDISDTLVGKISSSRSGRPGFIYLSLTNRLTEKAIFAIARKAGFSPRITQALRDGEVPTIRHGSNVLAWAEEDGLWTLSLPGWGEQIAIFNEMAIEAARKCGVKVSQIPASGSWMSFGGDGLRRRVIVDNGAFERAVKKSLGEEGYIKNLRRMDKDLCNRAEGGKFATVRLLVIDRKTDGHIHMIGSPERAGRSALVRGVNIVNPRHLVKARSLFSSTREEIEEICRLPAGSLDEVHGITTPNEVKWAKASPGEIIEVTMIVATDEGKHQSHVEPAARVHEYDVEVFPDAWEPESLAKIKKALDRGKEKVTKIVADNYRPLLLQEDAELQDGILDQNLARGYLGRPFDYEPILSALSRRLKSARWAAGANVEVVFAPFWGDYTLKPGEAILSAELKAQWKKYGSPTTFAVTRWPKVSTQSTGMLHPVADRVNGRKGLFIVVHSGVAPYIQGDNDDHLQVFWNLKARNDYKVMIETQVPVMVPAEGRLGDPIENPYVAMIAGEFSTGRTGQIMGSMARALSMINRNTVDRPDLRARASEYVYSTLGVDLQSSVQGAKKPTVIRSREEIDEILSLVETALKRHCDGKLIPPMAGVQRRTLTVEDFACRGISLQKIKVEFKWATISEEMATVVKAFDLDQVDLEKADNAGRNFETGVEAHRKLLASILKKFGAGEEFVKEMVQAISEGTVSEEQSRTLLSIGATYTQVLANREQTFPESTFWMDSVVYAMLSIAKAHK
jgi:hypothetical protein